MKQAGIAAAVAVAVAGILVGCSGKDAAQAGAESVAAAVPAKENKYATLADLPDFSGAWEPARMASRPPPGAAPAEGAAAVPPPPPPQPPKLTPEYQKKYDAFQEANRKRAGLNFVTEVANCIPSGPPGSMNQPYPIEILYTPGRVTIIIETYSLVRRVYLENNGPPEPEASYQGTSSGKWEGDTLVVTTTHILPETSPMQGIVGHGPDMKLTERIRLVAPDMLEIQNTIEDPAVFTEPYTTTSRYVRHRDWHLMEYVCAQNNRDQLDEKGNPGFNLD